MGDIINFSEEKAKREKEKRHNATPEEREQILLEIARKVQNIVNRHFGMSDTNYWGA